MVTASEIDGVTDRIGSSNSYWFNHNGHSFRLDETGPSFELWRVGVEVNGGNKLVCKVPRVLTIPSYISKILHLSAEVQTFCEQ